MLHFARLLAKWRTIFAYWVPLLLRPLEQLGLTQIVVNNNFKESFRKSLQDAILMSNKLMTVTEGTSGSVVAPVALIIDGTSLVYILNSELEEEISEDNTLYNRVPVVDMEWMG